MTDNRAKFHDVQLLRQWEILNQSKKETKKKQQIIYYYVITYDM